VSEPEPMGSIIPRAINSIETAPTILVDSREQRPLDIRTYPTKTVKLEYGDYSIEGHEDRFLVERKTKDDLLASLTTNRARFLRAMEGLKLADFAAVVVECDKAEIERGDYRSHAIPHSIIASLRALQVRHGIHVIWAGSHEGAAREVEGLVRQYLRGLEKRVQNLTI